jgi:hypothetical protein
MKKKGIELVLQQTYQTHNDNSPCHWRIWQNIKG